MRPPGARPTPRAVVVTIVAAAIVGIDLYGLALNLGAPTSDGQLRAAQVLYLTDPLWFGLVGGYLVWRLPGNVTARAMLVIGLVQSESAWNQGVLNRYTAHHGASRSLAEWAGWLNNWTWVMLLSAFLMMMLYFPDGRPVRRIWRRLELGQYTMLVVTGLFCLTLREVDGYPGLVTPAALGRIRLLGAKPVGVAVVAFTVYFTVAFIAVVGQLILRFRHSRGTRRAQLKWVLSSAALAGFVMALSVLESALEAAGLAGPLAGELVDLASQMTIPAAAVAIAVAVTRHGLFEIDRVVSRTVSYAVVVAVLAGAYVGVVAGVSALVPDRYGSVAVVLATLAVSALFVPVRRRVVKVVDHRFNRSRYDAAAVVAVFADRVRGRAGTGSTGEDLLVAARQVMQPAHSSVWLAPRSQA